MDESDGAASAASVNGGRRRHRRRFVDLDEESHEAAAEGRRFYYAYPRKATKCIACRGYVTDLRVFLPLCIARYVVPALEQKALANHR